MQFQYGTADVQQKDYLTKDQDHKTWLDAEISRLHQKRGHWRRVAEELRANPRLTLSDQLSALNQMTGQSVRHGLATADWHVQFFVLDRSANAGSLDQRWEKARSGLPAWVGTWDMLAFNSRIGPILDKFPATYFGCLATARIHTRVGTYRFSGSADDGVRLRVDDRLVLDNWPAQSNEPVVAQVELEEGDHQVQVEYAQGEGSARLSVSILPQPH